MIFENQKVSKIFVLLQFFFALTGPCGGWPKQDHPLKRNATTAQNFTETLRSIGQTGAEWGRDLGAIILQGDVEEAFDNVSI